MKFGVPWSVQEIKPEVRETAEAAARRSGMSLGDWLNSVIIQQAELDGAPSPAPAGEAIRSDELSAVNKRLDELSQRVEQIMRPGPAAYAPKRSRERLDPPAGEVSPAPPPEMPSVRLPPSLERAIAEISLRQRVLHDEAAAEPLPEPQPDEAVTPPAPQPHQDQAIVAPTPQPAQDLSGLEAQLRTITDQIATLRNLGVEQSISDLREELGEIGRTLGEAMPRRALETIEKQIHDLDRRIAEGHQAGVDAAALDGIEHGLAEVRDALHGLMPAETLIGFNDAIAGVAHKIDLIVADKDPATLEQLDNTVIALREMTNHIASDETVRGLSAQVQALGEKIDSMARATTGGDAFNHLEHRIAALSETLTERAQSDAAAPSWLEAMVESLHDKIEQSHNTHGTGEAFTHLDHRNAALSEALTARAKSDGAAPTRLEALVESLHDKIEQMQNSRDTSDALDHIDHRIGALSDMLAERTQSVGAVPARLEALMESLHDKVEHIQNAHDNSDAFNHLDHRIGALSDMLAERTQSDGVAPARLEALVESLHDKIEQIQNTRDSGDAFGHLEDRIVKLVEKLDASDSRLGHLEGIERGLADLLVNFEDIKADKDAGELRAPQVDDLKHDIARTQDSLEAVHGTLGQVVDRLTMIEKDIRGDAADSHGALNQPIRTIVDAPPLAPPLAPRRMPLGQMPIDSDLSDDQPLEPGSGPPSSQANSAARIAASDGALGGARPAAPVGKSSFIAAARRAAQAAGQQPGARAPRLESIEGLDSETSSLRAKMMKRVKSLFIAASIIAIVVGSLQIAGNVLNLGGSTTETALAPAPIASDSVAAMPSQAPEKPASIAANPPAAPQQPELGPLALPSTGTVIATTPPSDVNQTTQTMPSLFAPPMLGSRDDITGSISRPTDRSQAAPSGQPNLQADEQLPAAIGGPSLRSAALAGDAAAAYTVALRYAEGHGVPANMEEAAHWYERAASKGLAPAQFRYASLLEKGLGVKKDLIQARRLYLAAATKGHSKAMHNLAVLYAEGVDGKPEYATAAQWFRKAAQRGVVDSQYNLGVLCARGLGTDKSFAEAYKWFALAAAQGDRDAAKKRDDVAASLDAAALAAAQQAVKRFVAEPTPQDAAVVRGPPGGWDHAAGAPPQGKPRSTGPLALGTLEAGNR